jgi:hypothetical protein
VNHPATTGSAESGEESADENETECGPQNESDAVR